MLLCAKKAYNFTYMERNNFKQQTEISQNTPWWVKDLLLIACLWVVIFIIVVGYDWLCFTIDYVHAMKVASILTLILTIMLIILKNGNDYPR